MKLLKAADMFAQYPAFKFSTSKPRIESNLGLFFTFVILIILFWYTFTEFDTMFSNTQKSYISSTYALDLESLGEVRIDDYPDSFMFVMSLKSKS